jgi:hypothetical protein
MFLSHERLQHRMARRKKPKKGSQDDRGKGRDSAEGDGRQQSSLDSFAAIRKAVATATGNTSEAALPDSIAVVAPGTELAETPSSTPSPPTTSSTAPASPAPPATISTAASAADSTASKSIVEAAKIEPDKVDSQPTGTDEIRGSSPVRTFSMPSSGTAVHRPPTTDVDYHDLGELFSEAPVPHLGDGMVFHRGVLHELAGVSPLLDWVSEGDAVIVELSRIISRETEFAIAIDKLSTFIEGDIGGQIIQLTDSRLLLLPPGCRGIRGVETESFVTEA